MKDDVTGWILNGILIVFLIIAVAAVITGADDTVEFRLHIGGTTTTEEPEMP